MGRRFVEAATGAGHRVRILSRRESPEALPDGAEWARGDLVTGEGLEAAVRGADVVLHAASDPRGDPVAVDVDGTRRLLGAARRDAVHHLVYPSIVGIDRLPYSYYRAKLRAERAIERSGVPYTILRITQFHSFVEEMLAALPAPPLLFLPTSVLVQSIAVREVAGILLERVSRGPAGRASDVGGPEVLSLGGMARSWIRIQGRRRLVVPLPLPGRLMRALREGHATAPDRKVGVETWEGWLRRRETARAAGGGAGS